MKTKLNFLEIYGEKISYLQSFPCKAGPVLSESVFFLQLVTFSPLGAYITKKP